MAVASPAFGPTRKFKWLEQLARDEALSGLALRLGVLLATCYVNAETADAWPAQPLLCRDLGASAEGIRKVAKALADRGHLSLTPGRGQSVSSRYRPILWEPNPQQPEGLTLLETPTAGGLFDGAETPTPVDRNPNARRHEPPTAGGVNPLEENPDRTRVSARRRKRAVETSIPHGFPGAADIERLEADQQFSDIDVRHEAQTFREHALAHDRQAANWPAAFRMWVLKGSKRQQGSATANPQRRSAIRDWALKGDPG